MVHGPGAASSETRAPRGVADPRRRVAAALDRTGLPPTCLTLGITESMGYYFTQPLTADEATELLADTPA